MFGIRLRPPRLRRLIMPDDWEGHPLRKTHPAGHGDAPYTRKDAEEHQPSMPPNS